MRLFSLLHHVQTSSGAQAAFYPVGKGGKADHSPPSSAEVKNAWTFTFTPPVCLHGVQVILKNYEINSLRLNKAWSSGL
jgi:hypothetical protein